MDRDMSKDDTPDWSRDLALVAEAARQAVAFLREGCFDHAAAARTV